MGNEETQIQQEPSWTAVDASGDDPRGWPAFGDPVEWPDAMAWEQFFEGEMPPASAITPDDLLFPIDWDQAAPLPASGDDGPPTEAHVEPLDDRFWAGAPPVTPDAPDTSDEADAPTAAMSALGGAAAPPTAIVPTPGPTPVAGTETVAGPRSTSRWSRLGIRHGNALIIALVSLVSLVLLGMFLSVRARNDLQTLTENQPADQIGTQATVVSSTLPPTTATTAAEAPPSTVSLSDLIPADATGSAAGGDATTPTSGRTTGTTAAPARSAAPAGPTGGAPQPTNTTAAPQPDPEPTTPPAEDTPTTATTRRPSVPTSIPMPTFTVPSIPQWTAPAGRAGFPGFSN